MTKQIVVAFTAEGSTDELFLGSIILRTLNEISRQNYRAFDAEDIIWLGAAKGEKTLKKIMIAYEQTGARMLIIHRDTDQNSRQFIIDNHLSPILAKIPTQVRDAIEVVPLVIRHEQETWLFADLDALDEELDGNLDRHALNLPPNIESRANTKELFKHVLRQAGRKRSGRRGYDENDIVEVLATTIRLSQLAQLPSYQQFVTDLETALCKIGYIR